MTIQQIYCAGIFISTDEKLFVKNPFNGAIIAQTFLAGEKELDTAIHAAASVKEELKKMPAYLRYEILRTVSDELNSRKTELAEILCAESGKPIRYALTEIGRAAQTFLVAAEESKRLPREFLSADWAHGSTHKDGFVKYFPIGIVAGIAPFNFPMNLAVHKIAPAIAAGCSIILKPASSTPLSVLKLAEIIDKTILPKGAVSILPMNRSTGNQLVTDDRIALLSFTGSPQVGWGMKKQAGKKKVVLELGGNAGVIVSENIAKEEGTETALLAIVKKCVGGAFAYSGQICIHAQRIYVQKTLYKDFLKLFVREVQQLITGNPVDSATDVSCMIDEENAVRIENWIREAVTQGASVVHGGKRSGNFVEPCVLTNTNTSMKINCEEAFGPVVCIEAFETITEAIELVNDSHYGLQCGVFTDRVSEADLCFEKLEVGGVVMNDVPTVRYDHMPYGGVKDSGLGREGVKYAIADMLEARVMLR